MLKVSGNISTAAMSCEAEILQNRLVADLRRDCEKRV
jgi:hypothetical protein